jgi:hypothetical protein
VRQLGGESLPHQRDAKQLTLIHGSARVPYRNRLPIGGVLDVETVVGEDREQPLGVDRGCEPLSRRRRWVRCRV